MSVEYPLRSTSREGGRCKLLQSALGQRVGFLGEQEWNKVPPGEQNIQWVRSPLSLLLL